MYKHMKNCSFIGQAVQYTNKSVQYMKEEKTSRGSHLMLIQVHNKPPETVSSNRANEVPC